VQYVPAKTALALCMAAGFGCAQDPTSAARLASEAAAAHDADAHALLGVLHYSGLGLPRNVQAAQAQFAAAAEAGSPAGLFNQGVCLYAGAGGARADPAHAAQLFRRAASAGFVPAMVNLAACLMGGVAAPESPDEAQQLLQTAAAFGDAAAATLVAQLGGGGGAGGRRR
jgi:TPR repeat protein